MRSVCSLMIVRDAGSVDVEMTANIGQVSLNPPRIAISLNRQCPLEALIRRERQFAIGLLSESQHDLATRLGQSLGQSPNTAEALGLPVEEHPLLGIPYAPSCCRTLFCQEHEILHAGSGTLLIADVFETHVHAQCERMQPLLYREICGERFGNLAI